MPDENQEQAPVATDEISESSMVQAIREMRSQSTEKPDDNSEKPNEVKPDENKSDPPQNGQQEGDEALARRDGKPISAAARESFRKLETANKANKVRIEELEKELEKYKAGPSADDVTKHESYITLANQKAELEKRVELIDFENNPEFRRSFVEPRIKATDHIISFIKGMDVRKLDEISPLLAEMDRLNGNPEKENDFLAIADKIAESMSPSVGARFAKAAVSLFEAKLKENEAFKDKDSARREIFKTREVAKSSGIEALDKSIRAKIMAWEKTPTGKALLVDKEKDFQTKETLTSGMKKAMTAINDFVAGGTVTPDLQDILLFGAVGDVHAKERDWLLNGFKAMSDELDVHKKENEELKSKLEKLSADGGKSIRTTQSTETQTEGTGSAMVDALRQARNKT